MPWKKPKGKKRISEMRRTVKHDSSAIEEYVDYGMGKDVLKPYDQLELSEKDLDEKLTRILKTDNPHSADNIVVYSFKDMAFIPVKNIPQTEILYSLQGSLKLKIPESLVKVQKLRSQNIIEDIEITTEKEHTVIIKQDVKLRNMFNFYERATLTKIKLCKNVSLQTEPPPCSTFIGNATQWEMFDAFVLDKQMKDKEKGKRGSLKQKKIQKIQDTSEELTKLLPKTKIIERMLNLTIFNDIAQDFKYWEDPSDAYHESGNLLPLWKFVKPVAAHIQYEVTCLCWNPHYSDLFAVGLGSYNFMDQGWGKICLYSLKCPSHPEIVITVDNTVCSLDFHHRKVYLLTAGLYDGTVAVYNLKKRNKQLFLYSKDPNSKHCDPVWQVKWLDDNLDKNINFVSISGDGRVINWTIIKNELKCSEIIILKKEDIDLEGPEGILFKPISYGTALSFNKFDKALFLVGTEEGLIHKCSLAYSGQFLQTYKYHSLPIYKLQWNPYYKRVFISCSADCFICIWDSNGKDPLFEFDMKDKVDDVSWAPYSSTVFAAITGGKIYIYDLDINKQSHICHQVLISGKKTNLNHIAFNSIHPILIAGDSRGNITSFKLSPNLRKNLRIKNKNKAEFIKNEEEKFQKLLTVANK